MATAEPTVVFSTANASPASSCRQVGELGVVSFGGGGGALPLHPLERPFTDADGVRVMTQASGARQLAEAGLLAGPPSLAARPP